MWFQVVILLLQLAAKLVDWLRSFNDLDRFQQDRLATESKELLRKTEEGARVLKIMESLSDPALDDLLRQLGEEAEHSS